MTRQFKKLSHSLYECKYHVVFCPKYRYKILQDEVAKYVTQQIYRLCDQKDGVEVIELNVQKDHVHLVVSIPPKYTSPIFGQLLACKTGLDRFPALTYLISLCQVETIFFDDAGDEMSGAGKDIIIRSRKFVIIMISCDNCNDRAVSIDNVENQVL